MKNNSICYQRLIEINMCDRINGIYQRLEDTKICGGAWIVGGVMRHETS